MSRPWNGEGPVAHAGRTVRLGSLRACGAVLALAGALKLVPDAAAESLVPPPIPAPVLQLGAAAELVVGALLLVRPHSRVLLRASLGLVVAATVGRGAYPGSRAGSLVAIDRATGKIVWIHLDPPGADVAKDKGRWGFGSGPVIAMPGWFISWR